MKKWFWLLICYSLSSPVLLFSQTPETVAENLDRAFKNEALSFIKGVDNYNAICTNGKSCANLVVLNDDILSETFNVFFKGDVNFTTTNTGQKVEWIKRLSEIQKENKVSFIDNPTKEGLKAYEEKVISQYIEFLKNEVNTGTAQAIFLENKVNDLKAKYNRLLSEALNKIPELDGNIEDATLGEEENSGKGDNRNTLSLIALLLGILNTIGGVFMWFYFKKRPKKEEDPSTQTKEKSTNIIKSEYAVLKESYTALEQRIANLETTRVSPVKTVVTEPQNFHREIPKVPEIKIRYANEIKGNYFQSLLTQSHNAKYKLTVKENTGSYVIIGKEDLGEGYLKKDGNSWKITQIVQEPVKERKKIYAQPPSERGFLHLSYMYRRGSTSYVIEVNEDGNTGEFYLYENDLNYEDALKRFDTVLRYACDLPANMDLKNSKKAFIPKDSWGKVRKANGIWEITSKAKVQFLK